MSKQPQLSYKDAGVDIDAGEALVERIKGVAKRTARPEVMGGLGGFGALCEIPAGYRQPVLVSGTDGVGTKLRLAMNLAKHDSIGIDLVAMCVNDLVVCGAEPLFFLDYYATGKLNVDVAAQVVTGIGTGCEQAGCSLVGGETAEMPGMYHGNDYDLAGFAVGAAERGQLLPTDDIVEGDVLLGLASSGLHSNGFSLVRRIVSVSGLGWADAAPFADGQTLAEALLEPTHIYVKPLLGAIRGTHGIKALAHITGGGFPENIPRVLPKDFSAELDLDAIEVPPVFSWLAKTGGVAPTEMMRTFNCGVGMVLAVASGQAAQVAAVLQEAGETVTPIGRIVPRRDAGVIYRGSISL